MNDLNLTHIRLIEDILVQGIFQKIEETRCGYLITAESGNTIELSFGERTIVCYNQKDRYSCFGGTSLLHFAKEAYERDVDADSTASTLYRNLINF